MSMRQVFLLRADGCPTGRRIGYNKDIEEKIMIGIMRMLKRMVT